MIQHVRKFLKFFISCNSLHCDEQHCKKGHLTEETVVLLMKC